MPFDFFKQFRDAGEGYRKLFEDVSDNARVDRSNMDKMSLLKLMKKGKDVQGEEAKQSEEEKERKRKETSEQTRAAAKNVLGRN